MEFVLLVLLLIGLFFLSRSLNASLFEMFYRFTFSQKTSVTLLTLLFFPGTIVHELSHLFTAEVLGVRTGKISLVPEIIDDEHIQAGSVQVSRTDPFRRSIIGVAPLLVGVFAVTLLSSVITTHFNDIVIIFGQPEPWKNGSVYLFILLGYLLFTIVNNMFPSKEDMHGVPAVLMVIAIALGATYAVGVRFTLSGRALYIAMDILSAVTSNLMIIIGVNIALLLIVQSFIFLLKRINRKN